MSKDKQSIQVTIRVRPLSDKQKQEDNRICVGVEEHTHSIQTFYGSQNKKFTFDSICDNNSQDDMFQQVGKRSTVYCLQGYNCTIFAYGQTGSGKTFTMMGVDPAHENYDQLRGLIPRTLQYLFESIDLQIKQTSSEYIIRCSFLEIYNEQIIDLLNPRNNNNLQIREDIKKGVYVEGISQETIFKGEEALEILKKGSKGRHVGSTCYNETSSRSHSVFTMQIESKHTKNGVVNTKIRYFHFIDLAGSQRTKQINGDRLKQGCSINKSLHVLGKVINSLAESTQLKPRHINYRDSKLTFLLKDSLGGNSKTHLIANVSPCTMSYSETNMTLAFARRVKLIKVNKASINEDMSGNLQSLKSQIKRLKQQIILLRNGSMSTILTTSMLPKLDSCDSLQSYSSLSPLKDHQQHETKMLSMLNQYVSDQLDKQTKFSLQISKLYKKIQCLQQGIKKYSQNEMHFKLIINVYQDKVSRMAKGEQLLIARVDELSSGNDEAGKLLEYFRLERDELIKQVNQYKSVLSENCNMLLGLLKSCKAYNIQSSKQSQYKQQFLNLLKTNTEFLTSLSSQVQQILRSSEHQPQSFPSTLESDLSTMDKVIQQKLALIDLQYSKKQTQLMQRIQQMQLQIGDIKNVNEDNQMLLREAVDREISLQENLKVKQETIKQLELRNKQLQQKEQQLTIHMSKSSSGMDELTRQNTRLKEQLQHQLTSYNQLSHSHYNAITQNQQLQQNLSQLHKQNMMMKQKYIQLQIQLNDNTSSYQQKMSVLQLRLRESEQQFTSTINKLLQMKEQLKASQLKCQQLQLTNKSSTEQFNTITTQLQNKLIKQQKEFLFVNQIKQKLQLKNESLQQKLLLLNEQLQHNLQHTDKLTLQLSHIKHQCQHHLTKLTHLQSLLSQKQLNQQQLQQRLRQKQSQLVQTINQFQSSNDSSYQQINKVKIENLQLKQFKSELQLKVNKLLQNIKEHQLNIQMKNNKLQEIRLQLEEKNSKLSTEKQLTSQHKQTIRHLNYLIEQHRLSLSNKQLLISQKDQQFEEIHSKNINLLQQIATLKSQSIQHILKFKQVQTQLFCYQKAAQIQKESLIKQYDKKLNKLNQLLNEKLIEIKNNGKLINSYKLKVTNAQQELVRVKEMSIKTQESLKLLIQKEILNRSVQTASLKQHINIMNDNHSSQKQELLNKVNDIEQINRKLSSTVSQLTDNCSLKQSQNKYLISKVEEQQAFITELQQRMEQLKNTHQRQLVDLEEQHNHQIDSKNEEIELKNQEIQLKNQQLQTKKKQIINKDEQISAINQQLSYIKQQIQKIKLQLSQANQQIDIIKQQLNERDKTIQQNIVQIQVKNRLIEQTQKQIQSQIILNNENMLCLQQKNKQIRQIREILVGKQQGVSVYIVEMEEMRKQLQHNRVTLQQLSNQLEEKQCELQSNSLQLQQYRAQSQERVKQLEVEVRGLQMQIDQLMGNKQHSEQLIHTLTLQNNQMKQFISNKQGEIFTLRNHLNEQSNALISQISQMKQQLQQKAASLQQLAAQLQQVTQQKQQLSLNSEQQLNRSNQTNSQLERVTLQVQQLTISLQETTIKLQQLSAQLNKCLDSKLEKQRQIEQLSQKLDQITYKLQQTSQQLSQFSQSIQQKQTLISQLNTQLYQLQNNITLLQQSHMSITQQLNTVSHIKDTQQQQLRKAASQIHLLQTQLQEKVRLKYIAQSQLQQSQKRFSYQINNLNSELADTNKELQLSKQQTLQLSQQLSQLTQQLTNKLAQHQQHTQSLQQTINHLTQQKAQLLESYKSLQQINKGLGRKCEQFLTSIQQQKTQYRKLQTKYLGEKNINQNLKQLIQNNEQQKKRLSIELKQKGQTYNKLIQKIKSQQYNQPLSNRQSNQQLKRMLLTKSQLLQKKELQMKDLARKSQEYSKTIQLRVKQFQTDYLQLQSKYQQLLQNRKLHEATQLQNHSLKQQLQQSKPKLQRMTLKIEQLQQRIRSINQQYIELQQQNHQIKKKILYPSTSDQKVSMYLNKLKSEINDLKREKQILQQTIKKETSEKMRLKTQLIKSTNSNNNNNSTNTTTKQSSVQTINEQSSSSTKLQLQRKLTQIRYLQQIIAQMIDILKIKQFQHGTNPKFIKIESIRKGIVTCIKEKLQQNKMLKEKLAEMESRLAVREKENKAVSAVVYNGVGSGSSGTKKQSSSSSMISSSTVTMAKTEKREKTFSLKEQNQSAQNIKNKLNSTSSSQQYSQQKKQRKGLQIGDSVRTIMDATQQMQYNVREKMRVKQLINNHNGKSYRNIQ